MNDNPYLPHALRERIELWLSLTALVRRISETLLGMS